MRLAFDGRNMLLVFFILASLVDRSMTLLLNATAYFAFAWAVWAHFNVHPFNDHYWLVAIKQLLNHCATELRNKHSRLFIANIHFYTYKGNIKNDDAETLISIKYARNSQHRSQFSANQFLWIKIWKLKYWWNSRILWSNTNYKHIHTSKEPNTTNHVCKKL